jgi:hypothetical protein
MPPRQIITTSGGRVGLARARESVDDDEHPSKKSKTAWVGPQCRKNEKQVLICKHCSGGVSASNTTRRKQHLLACKQFLDSQEADEAAGSCAELKVALDAHRWAPGVLRQVRPPTRRADASSRVCCLNALSCACRKEKPELSKIARMVLVIPPASATSERVYSAIGRVWDSSRSRLTSTRVRKLLFVYFNRRALLRDGEARSTEDFQAFVEWLSSIPDGAPQPPLAPQPPSADGAPELPQSPSVELLD